MGGTAGGAPDAWYVAQKRMDSNELVIVQGHDHPLLLRNSLSAQDASWTAGRPEQGAMLSGKTRYRQADAACTLAETSGDEICVAFSAPQWAVTPGQSVVLYDDDVCLGGGIIAT